MTLKRQIIFTVCIILLALLSIASLALGFTAPNPTQVVQATGGDITPYFGADGYENRLMFEAMVNGLILFILVFVAGLAIWAYILNNRPKSPDDTIESRDEIHKAEDSVQETEEFMKRMERLSKRSKDEDDKKGRL